MSARAPGVPRAPSRPLLWKTEPLLTIRNKKVYSQ